MNHKPIHDEYDPWATYDPSPPFVRRTPKRVRNRKPTLASLAKQAAKAGIEVARYEFECGKTIVIPGSVAPAMTNGIGLGVNVDEWK